MDTEGVSVWWSSEHQYGGSGTRKHMDTEGYQCCGAVSIGVGEVEQGVNVRAYIQQEAHG